jgi:hypothetical protein
LNAELAQAHEGLKSGANGFEAMKKAYRLHKAPGLTDDQLT